MGAGGVMFAMATLLGLQGVLLAVPSLYLALKVLGGLYLAYLGIRIWRSAPAAFPWVIHARLEQDRHGDSHLQAVSQIDITRRVSASQPDVFWGDLDEHDLHILGRNPEGAEVLHHCPVELSFRIQRAAREKDDLHAREAWPACFRRQVVAGRVFDKAREGFVCGSP